MWRKLFSYCPKFDIDNFLYGKYPIDKSENNIIRKGIRKNTVYF